MVSACGLLHLVQFFSIAALGGVFFRPQRTLSHVACDRIGTKCKLTHAAPIFQSSNQANFTLQTTMGLPTSTQSEGSAAKLGVGAFGAFALGAAALL